MVSCCVNPACRTESKLLNKGYLYALERRSADTEFFWLCSACALVVEMSLDEMGGVSVRPRSGTRHPQLPHLDSRLRLVARPSVEQTPWHRASRALGATFTNVSDRNLLPSSCEAA
jgi:hypothetical protein